MNRWVINLCIGVSATYFLVRALIQCSSSESVLQALLSPKPRLLTVLTVVVGVFTLITQMYLYAHLENHLYNFSRYMLIPSCAILSYGLYGTVPTFSTVVAGMLMLVGSMFYLKKERSN